MPDCIEYTTFPDTVISPATGRSRPAIERSVVVLPHPDGPSSVKSLPSGTSNVTFWAAFTTWPLSFGYSVKSALTLSMKASRQGCGRSCFAHAEAAAERLRTEHQQEQRKDQHDAERGELDVLAVFPKLPDHDRH